MLLHRDKIQYPFTLLRSFAVEVNISISAKKHRLGGDNIE